MSNLKKLSIATVGAVFVATGLAAKSAQALNYSSTPHDGNCTTNGCVTSVSGATTIDFNGGTVPSSGFATFSYPNGTTLVRSTNVANTAAAPIGDSSPYLSIGPSPNASPVTVTFQSPVNYFGLYWGSIDSFNQISFYKNASDTTASATYSGTTILSTASGAQTVDEENRYVDFNSSNASDSFQKVVLSSSGQAFESDNYAYKQAATAVPWDFSSNQGVALAVPLFIGARMMKQRIKSKLT